ncbi:MAG TPA: hypothetical protein VL157_07520 [Gemmatimonadaceae bacterium]|nr:hypothetical protein [Gemmatimonadaceae bacterium]
MSIPSHDANRGVRGSVVILGADACLAALPATSTQLVNACLAFGYDDVIPASWGDELLAVGCLDQLAARDAGPAMACICPLVREQLRGASGVSDAAVRLVSPPVAAALYVRATSRVPLRITYVGDCPGAGHPSIDIHLAPAQFLTLLAERGITPGAQRPVPNENGHAARDRRRHYSLPGGVPAPEWLASEGIDRTLIDLGDLASLDPAQHGGRTLVDLAPRLGCVCSGALAGCAATDARNAVMLHEPPRSGDEVVDHAVIVSVADDAPARTTPHARDVSWPEFISALDGAWSAGSAGVTPGARAAGPPVARTAVRRPRVPKRLGEEGAILPRAYQTPRVPTRAASRSAAGEPFDAAADALPRERLTQPSGPDGTPGREGRRTVHDGHARAPAVREVRTRLATADRWLLSGLVLTGSVMVAVLTSMLTVRGMRSVPNQTAAAVVSPRPETVFVAAALLRQPAAERLAPPSAPVAESVATRTPARAVADAPPKAARQATAAGRPTRERAVPARPRPTPALAADRPRTAAPNALPAPAVAAPTSATPTTAMSQPAPAAPRDSAASNAQVLQALREIHDEIEARKHHIDSLTRALDSLKKDDPPR